MAILKEMIKVMKVVELTGVSPKKIFDEESNSYSREIPIIENGTLMNELRLIGYDRENSKKVTFIVDAYTFNNVSNAKSTIRNGKYTIEDCIELKEGQELELANDSEGNSVVWTVDQDQILGGYAILN